jgi:hypothetical protein
METCFEASHGEFITHTSTLSNKRPLGGCWWLKLCLNFKGKIYELSFDVLVGNKPSTSQTSLAVARDASIG